MKDNKQLKVENYIDQEYTLILERHNDDDRQYYSIRVLELEGCMTTGDTIEEVARDIQDAMREWLQLNIKLGKPIPTPLRSRRYSGKVMLRMPPSLHESLTLKASEQGVSLNQYLVTSLSRTLGYEEGVEVCISSEREKVKSNQ
jgi:predicted HicB family RNase H-like nuclease